jgi:phage terminase small subunit
MPARPKSNVTSIHRREAKAPDKPQWLSVTASCEWDRVIPLLVDSGRITQHDSMALAAYCELAAEFISSPSEFPSSKMTQLRLMMGDFGMTPSSRDKMPQQDAGKVNTFAAIFNPE